MVANFMPRMATINETAEITGLAKHHLRQLVIQDKIVHIKSGKKFLINVDKLIDFLNGGEATEKTPEPKVNGISRIEK